MTDQITFAEQRFTRHFLPGSGLRLQGRLPCVTACTPKRRSRSLLVLALAVSLSGAGWGTMAVAGERSPGNNTPATHASGAEAAGVGAGIVVGAIAGGPVGAIIAAALGGWVGDHFHDQKTMRVAAQNQAADSRAKAAALQSRLDGTQKALGTMEARLTAERQAHRKDLEKALSAAVYFPTDQSKLSAAAQAHLERIAALIGPMDGVVVHLDGYADQRGEKKYNQQLSAARADAVRQAFVSAGFPEERILTQARGETGPVVGQSDGAALALDRRVDIRIDNGVYGYPPQERVAQK